MPNHEHAPGPPTINASPGGEPSKEANDRACDDNVVGTTVRGANLPYSLDSARAQDPESFPNPPRAGFSQLPTTIPNVKHLLESYGVIARYNTVKKRLTITMPGQSGTPDNADNVALAQIYSLAALNGLSAGLVGSYVYSIADRNQYNSVADWITSKPWDQIDRLPEFYATLVQRDDFPEQLKRTLLHRWIISAVAAVFTPSGFRSRGVLTLQGPQSIGKTAWVNSLVTDPVLREQVVKLDHHLDAGSKDSLITAVSHWIVEIGELDSSFRKDVARLKGFLTSDRDKVRRPYARADSEYPRRTVFCATVNDANFLVDMTGNSRWWTIPVVQVDHAHGIDMQQVFAQVVEEFRKGEPWWLTKAEEDALEAQNKDHRAISATRERVYEALDLTRANQPNLPAMSAVQVLQAIGIENPRNPDCKEAASALREHLGEPKRIHGFSKWRVPLKQSKCTPSQLMNDLDLY